MATTKVTVTLPQEALRAVRALVATGAASSVSGFVQHAVTMALDEVDGWQAALAQAVEESGGGLTAEERAWADGVLTGRREHAA